VSSFKIEGRLKDVSYVKNITAYYRQRLDAIFAHNPAFRRSSSGYSTYTFTPAPEKSFNRGFTDYFLQRRADEITSFDTPKSIGEYVGVVEEVRANWASLRGTKQSPDVVAGDGLVFFNESGELEGFRVNKVEDGRIFPYKMPDIKPGTHLYRNYSHTFETLLSKPSAERKLPVAIEWGDYPDGFMLTMEDETGARVTIARPFAKEPARKPQDENIRIQLSKLGNTVFEATNVSVSISGNYFVPSSLLSEMRRVAAERLLALHKIRYQTHYQKIASFLAMTDTRIPVAMTDTHSPLIFSASEKEKANAVKQSQPTETLTRLQNLLRLNPNALDYTANIHNSKAKTFYESLGAKNPQPSFEKQPPDKATLMFTKHCLKYSLGWCPVHQNAKTPYKEPFKLIYRDTKLTLTFDCKNCQMLVNQ